jgi:hypothetical protein
MPKDESDPSSGPADDMNEVLRQLKQDRDQKK